MTKSDAHRDEVETIKRINDGLSEWDPPTIVKPFDGFKGVSLHTYAERARRIEPILTKEEEQQVYDNIQEQRRELLGNSESYARVQFTGYDLGAVNPSATILPVYATIKGDPGKEPDIVAWPYPSEVIKVKADDSGRGDSPLFNCQEPVIVPAWRDVWYQFVPSEWGTWSFNSVFDLSGWYMLNCVWGFCKKASVCFRVRVRIFQGFLQNDEYHTIFEEQIDGTRTRSQFLSSRNTVAILAGLRPNDPAILSLHFELTAVAQGGGAYAEINFEDGPQDFINPVVSWANKL